MLRPSMSATVSVSVPTSTPRTRSPALGAKMPIPCLLERRPSLPNVANQLRQLPGREADVTRKLHRVQPELRGAAASVHMHGRRLVRLVAVEVEYSLASAR